MFGIFKRFKKAKETFNNPPKPPIVEFIGVSKSGILYWKFMGKDRKDVYPGDIAYVLKNPTSFYMGISRTNFFPPYITDEIYKFFAKKFPVKPIQITWPDDMVTSYQNHMDFDMDKAVCWIRDECMKTKLGDEFE